MHCDAMQGNAMQWNGMECHVYVFYILYVCMYVSFPNAARVLARSMHLSSQTVLSETSVEAGLYHIVRHKIGGHEILKLCRQ